MPTNCGSQGEQITPKASDVNHVAAHWKEALNQFSLFFEDRLSIQ